MQENRVLHRDVKGSNILLTLNAEVPLIFIIIMIMVVVVMVMLMMVMMMRNMMVIMIMIMITMLTSRFVSLIMASLALWHMRRSAGGRGWGKYNFFDNEDDDADDGDDNGGDYDDGSDNAQVGTPYWMAPEVILSGEVDHQDYDARADVWSASSQ